MFPRLGTSQYEIIKKIGAGGTASVHLAVDTNSGNFLLKQIYI